MTKHDPATAFLASLACAAMAQCIIILDLKDFAWYGLCLAIAAPLWFASFLVRCIKAARS